MRPSDDLIVSSVEPTGVNRKKVWMQNTDTEQKIYVKNNNDVYEEFISKEDTLEKYSTNETKIGTWINGKKLYSRQFVVTSPQNVNTDEVVLTMPSDILGITRINAQLWSESANVITPVPYYFNSENYGLLFYNLQTRGFTMKVTVDAYVNEELLIYVEYTKTTD